MKIGINPKVDIAFKKVFGSEENRNVLQHLLNALLKESIPRPIAEVTILNPYNIQDWLHDKLSIVDIKARDEASREYIIEIQLFPHANFPERLLYYGAKEYSAQLKEGQDYSQLKPVIVICFVDANLFKDARDYHSSFELIDVRQQVRFSDHLHIHVVELPKFLRELGQLRDDLDRWIYFLQYGEELDSTRLPDELAAVPEIQQATGSLTMLSQNDTERAEYEARQKFSRDEVARVQYAVANNTRRSILRIGRHRLGEAPAHVVTKLETVTSVDELDALEDRILDCSNWDALWSN